MVNINDICSTNNFKLYNYEKGNMVLFGGKNGN